MSVTVGSGVSQSDLINRYDTLLEASIAAGCLLEQQTESLKVEVDELQNDNITLGLRLKQALMLVETTLEKWVHHEKILMGDLVSASRLQTTEVELTKISVTNTELHRENSIFKTEVDKLNAQLKLQALQMRHGEANRERM
jgi:hypothetical protein